MTMLQEYRAIPLQFVIKFEQTVGGTLFRWSLKPWIKKCRFSILVFHRFLE